MIKFTILLLVAMMAVASIHCDWDNLYGLDEHNRLVCGGETWIWGGPGTNDEELPSERCWEMCRAIKMVYLKASANIQNDSPYGLQCCCIDYRGMI